jgi:two-component system phosphate regulon response regulator PhoB
MVTASPKIHELLKASPRADEGGHRVPLVLLVEDHDDTRELYRFVLERRGYRIIEARDGEEAIVMAAASLPDLILMDSILPRVDGVMAAICIRQIAALHDAPIIFVSGEAEALRRTEALAAGGDEFLVKPVNLNCLEATIERQLLRRTNGMSTTFAKAS